MSPELRLRRLQEEGRLNLPFPGNGKTAARHRQLLELGLEDLSLARLAEAHLDALAILAEADSPADPTALYGVWASEAPDRSLHLGRGSQSLELSGSKAFCTGAGLVDRAFSDSLPARTTARRSGSQS